MKDKKIRILIEMPEKWVDLDSPFGVLTASIYDMVRSNVKDALVKEYVKKIELPKIKITAREIKEKMLEIMAQRALDREDI